MAVAIFILSLAVLGFQVSARNLIDSIGIESRHHDEGKLIFSTLLWRHGDRTPAGFAPNDPHRNASSWPVGFGQLTNLGKRQQFNVGKWLRRRYTGFLPEEYSELDFYIQSTDVDRTLMSAAANLAALYPPNKGQIWNKNLQWQPIPVHTKPEFTDFVLAGALQGNCPKFSQLFNDLLESPEMTEFFRKHENLTEYIRVKSGYPVSTTLDKLINGLMVRDTLFIERIHEKTLPSWTNAIFPSAQLDELALRFYILPAYTLELARLHVGYFLKEVLERSVAKVNKTLKPDRKVWAYSAHDMNIATVLKALGIFDNQFVQYAAMLMFELRQKQDGQVYLGILYRRRSDDEQAETLTIPGCGKQCKLARFVEIYKHLLPTEDFATACKL